MTTVVRASSALRCPPTARPRGGRAPGEPAEGTGPAGPPASAQHRDFPNGQACVCDMTEAVPDSPPTLNRQPKTPMTRAASPGKGEAPGPGSDSAQRPRSDSRIPQLSKNGGSSRRPLISADRPLPPAKAGCRIDARRDHMRSLMANRK